MSNHISSNIHNSVIISRHGLCTIDDRSRRDKLLFIDNRCLTECIERWIVLGLVPLPDAHKHTDNDANKNHSTDTCADDNREIR
ncbi:hypothetical protein NY2A_b026R [Paramecium bursaria Chlorella virus NY2A]|uniref:Uncharacterized protein b026R n=1 Tax=Paramecium bursaria Chlorella virus NY2A TaxID=46021 RepID=A7IVQ1_PBCVN|nr:hypothetical protein NY2A_b026R [Paramecium bursaria Chlorella virus NY2A]ABT14425.1 hypothetical protein NY2A_b026R [Paramecium bursaria Chlorella virus NY2A]